MWHGVEFSHEKGDKKRTSEKEGQNPEQREKKNKKK